MTRAINSNTKLVIYRRYKNAPTQMIKSSRGETESKKNYMQRGEVQNTEAKTQMIRGETDKKRNKKKKINK